MAAAELTASACKADITRDETRVEGNAFVSAELL